MRLADVRAALLEAVGRARSAAYRILDTVPTVRRAVDDLVRVEVVDRAMVIGAQALLALLPMLIVLAAFLPHEVVRLALDRFESVVGIGHTGRRLVEQGAGGLKANAGVTAKQVRAATGLAGILIVLFSATSFSRAIQRMYERVWEQHHVGGIVGRRRCLSWLLGWLVLTQGIALVGALAGSVDRPALAPFWFGLRVVVGALIWWWSMRVLLFGRVAWTRLLAPAMVTGLALTVYTGGSTLVMPTYVASSAKQFGTLGLVLALATWLVGYAGVMVVSAVLGRVLAEDETVGALMLRIAPRLGGRSDTAR